MPAMSPTMTEGGIAGWKKLQGEPFVAGDVLLEIVRVVRFNPPYSNNDLHFAGNGQSYHRR